MNRMIVKTATLLLALAIMFPITATSQEKKVHIKKVQEVDGKKVVIDTVFVITGNESDKDVLKEFVWVHDGDSSGSITLDIDVDQDFDIDTDVDRVRKVIVYKGEGHDNKSIIYFNGEESDFDEEKMVEMRISMDELSNEMDNVRIEFDEEKIIILKELEELEGLKELEHLELLHELGELEELREIENIEVIMSDFEFSPDHHNFWVDHRTSYHGSVTEKELRDAGINVKADRLDINDYNIDIDNGVVDLEFTIENEASPKVAVFNFYGDKVFSGKPVIAGGRYSIKIDLSTKQHGTYYLQITNKNSSVTKKFRL